MTSRIRVNQHEAEAIFSVRAKSEPFLQFEIFVMIF